MRHEADQSFYTVIDPADQPQAKFAMFIGNASLASTFLVDDVTVDSGTVIGVRVVDNTRKVVVIVPESSAWSVVALTHLELATKRQAREFYLEALPEKMRSAVREQQIVGTYKKELQQASDPEDIFRRMMGDSGGEPL